MPKHVKTHKNSLYVVVEKRTDFYQIIADLEREMAIGVDLEADSLFHYREKVCLLQISTRSQNIIFDPISLGDLSPMASLFADPRVRKIFHGADYDIRSLYRDFGIVVHSLFDTQIAARFLGLRETSLANLLKERFGMLIKKKYQKSDWSKRPLQTAMLTYAAQDAGHLLPLATILKKELRSKGWLSWVEEECEILSKVRPVPPHNNPLFLKFRGAGSLDVRSLAVLEAILKFRVDVASRWDRPPFKVLGNTPIIEMVEKKPKTLKDLKDISGMNPKLLPRLSHSLLKRIHEALNLPDDALPVYPRKARKPIGARVSKRVKALKEWRDKRAGRLGIDPPLICNNVQIQSLALAHLEDPKDLEGVDELRKWQRQLFGREIITLLKTLS